jgi:ABC-type Zn uptake system ZnuABC Zn-binding protein ZnuA
MTERDNLTDPQKSKEYSQNMTALAKELETLRAELQNLMVRFGVRALKLYQTGTSEPLQSQQMSYLIKYELTNAIADLQDPKNMEGIINQTKEEWKKPKDSQPST